MLDNYTDGDVYINNLEIRFKTQLNYTCIRNILVSINPFEDLGVFSPELIREYSGRAMFELPPHLYAVANQVSCIPFIC